MLFPGFASSWKDRKRESEIFIFRPKNSSCTATRENLSRRRPPRHSTHSWEKEGSYGVCTFLFAIKEGKRKLLDKDKKKRGAQQSSEGEGRPGGGRVIPFPIWYLNIVCTHIPMLILPVWRATALSLREKKKQKGVGHILHDAAQSATSSRRVSIRPGILFQHATKKQENKCWKNT